MAHFTDVSTEELLLRAKEDDHLLVVDLRDRKKYLDGHIKGAVSFPMKPTLFEKLLKKRALKKLLGPDPNRTIAFY